MSLGVSNGKICEQVAEIQVSSDFDVKQVASDVRFYANQARLKGRKIVVEIWSVPKEELPRMAEPL